MRQVTADRFEELVVDALDSLPDGIAALLDNVVITVEDRPTEDQEFDLDGHHQEGLLLGLYEGVDMTQRGLDESFVMPDQITIFRLAHLAISRDEDELVKLVAETVVHEIGHHFGLDDARLHELGWG